MDALGKTILAVSHRLAVTNKEERPGKVIFVITTDGLENASCEFTYRKVNELIQQQQEKHGWEFIFLGANIDAAQEAASIGIARNNAYKFQVSEAGVKEMYCIAFEAVKEKRFVKGKKNNQ